MAKHILRLVPALLLLSAVAQAAPESVTYRNSRFGYSIAYPADLLRPLPESDDGSGRAFAGARGHAGFRVFAKPAQAISPTALAHDVQKICPGQRPSYQVTKPWLVAVSCVTGGQILYQKTLLRGGLELTVRGEYSAAERITWDPVVTSIARSMVMSTAFEPK